MRGSGSMASIVYEWAERVEGAVPIPTPLGC